MRCLVRDARFCYDNTTVIIFCLLHFRVIFAPLEKKLASSAPSTGCRFINMHEQFFTVTVRSDACSDWRYLRPAKLPNSSAFVSFWFLARRRVNK